MNEKMTRMHTSMMRTARSLTVSHRKNHARPPGSNHAWPPRSNHTHPPGSSHACPPWEQPRMPSPPREQPCMPPQSNHACPPEQPYTPLGATMHAPLPAPRATTHAPPHPPPRATTHAPPEQSCTPPLPRGQTDTCKNITFANFVCGR